MRRFRLAVVTAFGVAAGAAAQAQTREDMERCRAVEDDQRRLDCYDAIRVLPRARSKYQKLPFEELKEFALSYRGQLVEVNGWITPGEDLFFLARAAADQQTMPVDFEQLPRHEREAFLDQCGAGCEATIQGRVNPVNFTTGIVADTLIVR